MTPEQRGERARLLLDDDLLKDAFALIEADCVVQWKGTAPANVAGREKLWQQLKAIEAVKAKLQQAIADGKIAKASR